MANYGTPKPDLNEEILIRIYDYSFKKIEEKEGEGGNPRIAHSKVVEDIANYILTEVDKYEGQKN